MPDSRTYAAFISYSHATDHELGPSLQEGIEKFAKPRYRARSRWVAKEVAWWLENRHRRTLFVLLTDGEAVWDNGVLDTGRTTALPEVLHGIPEPRCVDLRGVRDAELDVRNPDWEPVLADVVAPLDGVEKTELIGHHIRNAAASEGPSPHQLRPGRAARRHVTPARRTGRGHPRLTAGRAPRSPRGGCGTSLSRPTRPCRSPDGAPR